MHKIFASSAQFRILVRTYSGLEDVLMEELKKLGAADPLKLTRAVECTGDLGFVYKLNLALRSAVKVLVPLNRFRFENNDEFYKGVFEVPWPELFDADKTFAFDSIVFSRYFSNSMFVSQLAKDAVADKFRAHSSKRPFIDNRNPQVPLSIYVRENEATVYLDSSGVSLHQRGYKTEQVKAPLSEVMAAGIIQMSGWSSHFPFIDPMCGSGTFAIEAALLAANVPPGIFRAHFGFEHWKSYDKELYTKIFDALCGKITEQHFEISASDIRRASVNIARENAERANLASEIKFAAADFTKSEGPGRKAFVFVNPPYGERLNPEHLETLYAQIGSTLKHRYAGCEAWVFTAHPEAVKLIGLKPGKKIKLMNGPLECLLLQYVLYDGSKKIQKNV
jgi:putative N6-adenine-specific DNA methylase